MRFLLLVSLSAALLAQTPAKTESSDLDSLVSMVESKLPDSLILKQVQKSGKVYNLQPQDLVRLQKAGASEKLLEALMEGPPAASAPAAPAALAPPAAPAQAPVAPERRAGAEAPAAAVGAEAPATPATPKKKSWLQQRMEQTGQRMMNNGKNSVERSIDKTASSVENTADRAASSADSKVNRTMDNAQTSVDKKVNNTLGTPATSTTSTTTTKQ